MLSRLNQRLEAAVSPQNVLPTMVETIAIALKLPYVAVALERWSELAGEEPIVVEG